MDRSGEVRERLERCEEAADVDSEIGKPEEPISCRILATLGWVLLGHQLLRGNGGLNWRDLMKFPRALASTREPGGESFRDRATNSVHRASHYTAPWMRVPRERSRQAGTSPEFWGK